MISIVGTGTTPRWCKLEVFSSRNDTKIEFIRDLLCGIAKISEFQRLSKNNLYFCDHLDHSFVLFVLVHCFTDFSRSDNKKCALFQLNSKYTNFVNDSRKRSEKCLQQRGCMATVVGTGAYDRGFQLSGTDFSVTISVKFYSKM